MRSSSSPICKARGIDVALAAARRASARPRELHRRICSSRKTRGVAGPARDQRAARRRARHLRDFRAGAAAVEQARIVRPHGDRGAVAVPAGARLRPRRRRRVAGRSLSRRPRRARRSRAARRARRGTAAPRAGDRAAAALPSRRHAARRRSRSYEELARAARIRARTHAYACIRPQNRASAATLVGVRSAGVPVTFLVPRHVVAARRRARGRSCCCRSGTSEVPVAIGAMRRADLCWRVGASTGTTMVRLAAVIRSPATGCRVDLRRRAGDAGTTWSTIADDAAFPAVRGVRRLGTCAMRAWSASIATVAVVVALWIIDAYVQMTHRLQSRRRGRGRTPFGHLRRGESEARSGARGAVAVRSDRGARTVRLARARGRVRRARGADPARRFARGVAHVRARLARDRLARDAKRSARSRSRFGVGVADRRCRARSRFAIRTASVRASNAVCSCSRGTESAVDAASAGRLSIWRTALAMWHAHPLTGVGVRGFRYAYPRTRRRRIVSSTSRAIPALRTRIRSCSKC